MTETVEMKLTTCKDSCPVPIKNVFLGCNCRPEKYKKECPRLKEFEKRNKKRKSAELMLNLK